MDDDDRMVGGALEDFRYDAPDDGEVAAIAGIDPADFAALAQALTLAMARVLVRECLRRDLRATVVAAALLTSAVRIGAAEMDGPALAAWLRDQADDLEQRDQAPGNRPAEPVGRPVSACAKSPGR